MPATPSYTWRSITPADAGAWARLLAAIQAQDRARRLSNPAGMTGRCRLAVTVKPPAGERNRRGSLLGDRPGSRSNRGIPDSRERRADYALLMSMVRRRATAGRSGRRRGRVPGSCAPRTGQAGRTGRRLTPSRRPGQVGFPDHAWRLARQ